MTIYERHEAAECLQWDGTNQQEILDWAREHGFDGYYDDGMDDVMPGVPGFEIPHPYIKLCGCGGPQLDEVGQWLLLWMDGDLAVRSAANFKRDGWKPVVEPPAVSAADMYREAVRYHMARRDEGRR